jgi:hypothetical protein
MITTMMHATHYFDRAGWAFHNAHNDKLPLNVRSHLTAVAVHACQSLKESLIQVSEDSPGDTELAAAIKTLPHTELIENIRNMDLHGWPLPICDPSIQMVAMVSKPGKPITLSSSHGIRVAVTMPGVAPKVHNPNRKCVNVKFGGSTVSFGCVEGKLIVHDFSTDKDYALLDVLREFLEKCHPLVKCRMPTADGEGDATPPKAS